MTIKESIADTMAQGKGTHCKVCGVSSYEQTLIGLKNDRKAKPGERFCLPHHPDSFVGAGAYVLEVAK